MTNGEAAAILESEAEYLYSQDEPYNRQAFNMAIEALQERKTGKWILSPVDGQWNCSACNHILWRTAILALGGMPNACPWCCVKMEVENAE